MRPENIYANLATAAALAAACVMPLVGSVVDHTRLRKHVALGALATMSAVALAQATVGPHTWFAVALLQIVLVAAATSHSLASGARVARSLTCSLARSLERARLLTSDRIAVVLSERASDRSCRRDRPRLAAARVDRARARHPPSSPSLFPGARWTVMMARRNNTRPPAHPHARLNGRLSLSLSLARARRVHCVALSSRRVPPGSRIDAAGPQQGQRVVDALPFRRRDLLRARRRLGHLRERRLDRRGRRCAHRPARRGRVSRTRAAGEEAIICCSRRLRCASSCSRTNAAGRPLDAALAHRHTPSLPVEAPSWPSPP